MKIIDSRNITVYTDHENILEKGYKKIIDTYNSRGHLANKNAKIATQHLDDFIDFARTVAKHSLSNSSL